jgi:two-component system, NarL family, nitrate/nitrite response regulator NarL
MINLLIVSDTPLHREGLALRLQSEPGMHVVGSWESIRDTLPVARSGKADVIVIDVPPTWDNRRELAAAVRAVPAAHFVTLAEAESGNEVVAWAEAGAAGIVDRKEPPLELRAALETVMRGELHCSSRVAASLLRHVQSRAQERKTTGDPSRLTQRECDILLLIGQGMTNKEIARHLSLQLPTVKNHIHNLFEKLGVHTRAEAVALSVPWNGQLKGRVEDHS